MKGTVLGPGVILSADEQRYAYLEGDVKSVTASGATVVLRQGDEVEFRRRRTKRQRDLLNESKISKYKFR